MTYICIYNETTREIAGAETYDDERLLEERLAMYALECYARGIEHGEWRVYRSTEGPFAFPVEEPTA